jgi:hypothetical protein
VKLGRLRLSTSAALWCLLASSAAAQSGPGQRSSIVIAVGEQPTVPIPTLMEGAAGTVGNIELADQLFLRLARLGPTLLTAGDRGFVPLLARSWPLTWTHAPAGRTAYRSPPGMSSSPSSEPGTLPWPPDWRGSCGASLP